MEYCELIRTARERAYATPRQFHQQKNLSCSYFYYTKVERGSVPELTLAIEIIKALGINQRRGLYAWVRSQMPDGETKALFADLGDAPARSTEQTSVNRSMVVNRMQAKLIATDPVYWEILLFISCHHDIEIFTPEQIAKNFKMPPSDVRKMLHDLYEYGLLEKDENGQYVSREWIYIPYDPEFFPLREQNFKRGLEKFLELDPSQKYRTTITRLVTPEQDRQIQSYIDALTSWIIDLPDERPPTAMPYTIGVFASKRGFGNG